MNKLLTSTRAFVRKQKWVKASVLTVAAAMMFLALPAGVYAQANLGTQAPQFGAALPGESAAQPEGAWLNLVNYVGNTLMVVGAGLSISAGAISITTGRNTMRYLGGGLAMLLGGGFLRVAENFVTAGTTGVRGTGA